MADVAVRPTRLTETSEGEARAPKVSLHGEPGKVSPRTARLPRRGCGPRGRISALARGPKAR